MTRSDADRLAVFRDDVDAAVAGLVATVLPGGDPASVDDVDTGTLLARIRDQRVSGLAVHSVDTAAVTVESGLASQLRHEHTEALRTALAAEAVAREVSRALSRGGVTHVVSKGCATAHLDYPDPSLRPTGDVDIVVLRRSHDEAIATLAAIGAARLEPAFRTSWERRFGKDVPMIGTLPVEVDMHVGLVAGYFGVLMTTGPLFEHTVEFELGGRRALAFDHVGRLIHAAVHSASGSPLRLASAADVVQIAHRASLRPTDLQERCQQVRALEIVAHGIRRVWAAFGVEACELSEWAAAVEIDQRGRRALATLADNSGEARWWDGVHGVPWHARPGYIMPLLWPSAEFLEARGRTRWQHLRQSGRRLRPRRPRH